MYMSILNLCYTEFFLSFILQYPFVIYFFTPYYSSGENIFLCLHKISISLYLLKI